MNSRIENSISRIAEQARGRYKAILENARHRAEIASDRVTDGKKPVKTLSKLGLKLTAVSHRATDKVLKQQLKMLENQIDAFAGRLSAAANATDVGNLIKTQFRLIPENAAVFAQDARNALGVIAGAGVEARDLMKATVVELRDGTQARATKPGTQSRTPARKKTAKKKARVTTKTAAKTRTAPSKAA